jgi:hypothetical protein
MRSKASEELLVYLLLGAINLATLPRPRGAERVEYEGIPYSQRCGIHHNPVGTKNRSVERHVTVAVKPRGWRLVRHKVTLE